jgi:N-acetylmuramoyl-L-alanine amidase
MRSGAGTDYKIIGKLDKGTAVAVCEFSGDWAKIKLKDGTFAWVCRDYIHISDSNASRSLEGSRPPAENGAEADNSDLRSKIVEYAKKYLGVKYVYGGSSPKGFDCSGFVQYVFKNFNIELARSSEDMGAGGEKISKDELRPGDLVFFDTNGGHNRIEHVGIYIGDGKFIHSSSGNSAKCVIISTLTEGFYQKTYMTAKRYID